MATTVDSRPCEELQTVDGDAVLPASPFYALQYHFGMLLGVDDLEAAQAYPRGKIRLHNAWLHGDGVVWGLGVGLNDRRELYVDPGLALDAAGHELHVDRRQCVDLGKWFEQHSEDPKLADAIRDWDGGRKRIDLAVIARFTACLTRAVPAISDPCAGSTSGTAFSRAYETVELLLRPQPTPSERLDYPRLRVLFGLADDDVAPSTPADVVAIRDAVQALAASDQPRGYLEALRRLAAFDGIDREPEPGGDGLFPRDPAEVWLANVSGIVLRPLPNGGWALDDPLPAVDVTVRRTLLPTETIQELLCGPRCSTPATPPPEESEPSVEGPRIDPATVVVAAAKRITLAATAAIDPVSAPTEAFSVTSYDATDGWSVTDIRRVTVAPNGTDITLDLREATRGTIVRVIARGTGPTPILGTNGAPLAGVTGGPPGSRHDGHDFVCMLPRA